MIQVRLNVPVRRIRTNNGTEFVNQTLRDYYEEAVISHETSVARSPQQNGVVERHNRTLIEAARTMLIYAQAPLFLWAEAVGTACFTQNRSIICLRHGKTPEHVDKLQPKADIGIFIGYAPTKKAFCIYNRVDNQAPEVIAPIAKVIPQVDDDSTGLPSSTPMFIIKFLKMIQVRLNVPVRRIRTNNGTEFVNQTLRDYYEEVGISHETYVARSPQQNGVVERRNRTLIEAARTMLIYAQAPLFLWVEAVATACFTQNRSIIRLCHGKTPYELMHAMASEQRSSGPALNDMIPGTISLGLVQKSSSSTSSVPPSRN
nr:hypothetical protein [Tanacetum cinerariifolium]